MGSSSGSGAAQHAPAQLAKAALRQLAEQRLEPTPENFRKAYEAEQGVIAPTEPAALDAPAALTPSADGERWSQLIGRIVRGAERGGRQWTTGRKKDSLQRVLEGSKSSASRLHQRLTQLVGGWDSDTLDDSLLEVTNTAGSDAAPAATTDTAPATAAHEAGEAWPPLAEHALNETHGALITALPDDLGQALEAKTALQSALTQSRQSGLLQPVLDATRDQITQACGQARRIIEHRYHLVEQLNELCHTLTDSLVELAEDDSWVQGQCQAMQFQLEEGLHSRGVKHMLDLLEVTRQRQ